MKIDAEPLELSEMCTCGHSRVWHHSRRFVCNWGHSPSQGVSHSCGCEEFELRAARGLSPDVTEESAKAWLSQEVNQCVEAGFDKVPLTRLQQMEKRASKLAIELGQTMAERDAARAEVEELKRERDEALVLLEPFNETAEASGLLAGIKESISVGECYRDSWLFLEKERIALLAQLSAAQEALKAKDDALKDALYIGNDEHTKRHVREKVRAALAIQPNEQEEGV